MQITQLNILLFLISAVLAAFDANAKNNLAIYWGQGANQKSLKYYCDYYNPDIMVVSFVNWLNSTYVGFNFGNACSGAECPIIAAEMKYCQNLGIKILLSIGGDKRLGDYGVESDVEGEAAAQLLYDMFNFNGNSKVTKPFGSKTQIDGFDFDIENHNQNGQIALVKKLRSLWGSNLLISACPQCTYPDPNVMDLISDGDANVDLVFLQFYSNSGCSMIFNTFTDYYAKWANYFENITEAKNQKLYFTLPADDSGKWYVNLTSVNKQIADKKLAPYVGGAAIWDCIKAENNFDDTLGVKMNYVEGIKYVMSGVYNKLYIKDEL